MAPIMKNMVENHRGHTVLAFTPGSSPLVLDGGAHKGEFARSVAKAWNARCHSVEASPSLFMRMELPNGAIGYNFAIAGQDGKLSFAIEDNPEASHIDTATAVSDERHIVVQARGLGNFLREIAPDGIDLLKLDIEGAEIVALESLSDEQLQKIGQITVEFHDFCGYITSSQTDQAIARLRSLGFAAFNFSFRTRGDVLLVNTNLHRLSLFDKIRLSVFERVRQRLLRSRRQYS
jgi:FkbM family methyltransferase